MNAQAKPVPVDDPAGLDKLLLAAGEGVARFLEGLCQEKLGRPVNLWDGPDGLGAVLDEHLKAAGVPNKRLPELLTPRTVAGAMFNDWSNQGRRIKIVRKRMRRLKP